MECDDAEYSGAVNITEEENRIAAVNSTILNYYKKFGRKRDLEQYFSLTTAQSEIRDPTSLFWRRMKSQNESESSGERSSTELCRISIKCSVADPEPSYSQDENSKTKSDTESPPIITEDLAHKSHDTSKHSDNESIDSDDNHSQKSMDATLDTSTNKPFSPTSSITSQRKLEWDSLADVGYANETDRKKSASSLSTLERLALLQQYSNNDTKNDLGLPTAHSTPLDENDSKSKGKKGVGKVTKIYRRDVDCVEVNVPHSSETNPTQAINVNLTKHISFNVDGGVTIENVKKDFSVTPEKVSVQTEVTPNIKSDKEIQTTLTKEKPSTSEMNPGLLHGQSVPVLINLNTLKKRNRRRKVRTVRKRVVSRNKYANKENVPVLEKSGDQVSEAESFEYMPGHMYNQNQRNEPSANTTAGNKSSLESSGAITTDSSKNTKHSFTKDLEKSIKLLKAAMQKRYDDSDLKKRLVKEVVQRLLKSSYRDDESTTDFLSGLSFSSKKIGIGDTTTSTSDANNTDNKRESMKPKKSILRIDKFNANAIASTSQSAPNLISVSKSEQPVTSSLRKPSTSSNTESDASSREKNSSDTAFAKTSSEELYQKYIDALRREQAYKKHLRDKEIFLKQKLVSNSESAIKVPVRLDVKSQNRLKDLMKDLTRNNYDDGSGDASKLEGGPSMYTNFETPPVVRSQRSHSVFTLSSGNSDCHRKTNSKRSEMKDAQAAGCSKNLQHYCCCPFHSTNKMNLTDSSVQVNIKQNGEESLRKSNCSTKNPMNIARVVSDDTTGDIKYVCLCNNKIEDMQGQLDNFLIYKCSRLPSKGIQSQEYTSNSVSVQCKDKTCPHMDFENAGPSSCFRMEHGNLCGIPEICTKSSQTNFVPQISCVCSSTEKDKGNALVHEAVRCLQTEISINPKISDPSLSDINIVSETECARFIREQYRVVSKSSSRSDATNQEQICMSTKVSEENLNKCECGSTKVDKEIQSGDEQIIDKRSARSQIGNQPDVEDKFRIPIQGTNMTLMVSIGSNVAKPVFEKPRNDVLTQAIVTDSINTNENATCLRDECSIGIQSCNDDENPEYCSPRFNQHTGLVDTLFTRQEFYDKMYLEGDAQTENKQVSECSTYPKMRFVEKPFLRSNTGDVEKILTSRHIPEKSKCSCPESARCNRSCGSDFDCNNQKSIRQPNMKKNGKDCGSPRPLPSGSAKGDRKSPVNFSDTANHNSVGDPCGSRKQDAKKDKCSCPEKARCKGLCGPDFDCVNQRPCPRSDSAKGGRKSPVHLSDGKNKNSGSESCGSRSQGTKNKHKCSCPESARCKGLCGPDFDCANQKPFPRSESVKGDRKSPIRFSDRENENLGSVTCDPRSQGTKRDKCSCPETAKCKGLCGPDFDCTNQRPFPRLDYVKGDRKSPTRYSTREIKNSETDACDSRSKDMHKDKCSCPETARCKGNCGADFDCKNQRPFPSSSSDKESSESSRQKQKKIEKESSCSSNERYNKKKSKCSEGEDFDRLNQEQILRSNVETGDSEYNTQSDREIIEDTIAKILQKKAKCGCPEWEKCDGNCPDNAACRKKEIFIQPDSNDGRHVVKSKSTKGKQCYIQTDHVNIDNRETQNENVSDYSQSGKLCSSSADTKVRSSSDEQSGSNIKKSSESDNIGTSKDLILEMIHDITKRYSKKDIEKSQRKKCFSEIMTILKYLLDTEDGIDSNTIKAIRNDCRIESDSDSNTKNVYDTSDKDEHNPARSGKEHSCAVYSYSQSTKPIKGKVKVIETPDVHCRSESKPKEQLIECGKKVLVDKAVQLNTKKSKSSRVCNTESSDVPASTDCHGTSSDSVTCKVLSKIKKECEKYHQKRCKCYHSSKTCEGSSSTSVNCDQCKRAHYCLCRSHRCKNYRPKSLVDKIKKKCVAYNLIIQTSESMISEETVCECNNKPLQNIIVKVPKRKNVENLPFKEVASKIERHIPCYSPRSDCRTHRSRSLPKESGLSRDDCTQKQHVLTVRDYLERNRPDFVEQCSKRQNCLKMIGESRANERASYRDLLSMQLQLDGQPSLRALSQSDLRQFARQLGVDMRRKAVAPKFTSEREMKKHSEKIYKSLPEVVRKKEELKKEGIKRTNLLLANIFKKNLQRKTLRGSVNLSNYNTILKI